MGMFLGCVLESFGYGLLTVMTGFTLNSLWGNKQTRYPSRLLLTVLALIWFLSTGHWITNVYRAYQAFLVFPAGPIAFYNMLNLPSYTVRNVLYCCLVLVADAFAVYRVYRVWNGRWYVVVFPIIMVFGSAIAGFGTTYWFASISPGAVFGTEIVPWGTAWYAMNLATNGTCTFLIAFRIVQSQRTLRKLSTASSARLFNTLVIILESAAIYSSATIVLLTTTVIGTNSAFVVLDMTVSIVGITFTMIILRVSMGVSSDTQSQYNTGTDTLRMPTRSQGDLTVNVSRLVEVNAGPGHPYAGTRSTGMGMGAPAYKGGYADVDSKLDHQV